LPVEKSQQETLFLSFPSFSLLPVGLPLPLALTSLLTGCVYGLVAVCTLESVASRQSTPSDVLLRSVTTRFLLKLTFYSLSLFALTNKQLCLFLK
jgi:hypothetical protein